MLDLRKAEELEEIAAYDGGGMPVECIKFELEYHRGTDEERNPSHHEIMMTVESDKGTVYLWFTGVERLKMEQGTRLFELTLGAELEPEKTPYQDQRYYRIYDKDGTEKQGFEFYCTDFEWSLTEESKQNERGGAINGT